MGVAISGSRSHACPDSFDDSFAGRQDAQRGKRAAIDQAFSIYENLEFTVPAANHIDLGFQLPTNPCRHPDGMQP
jgi:hypothetical protein